MIRWFLICLVLAWGVANVLNKEQTETSIFKHANGKDICTTQTLMELYSNGIMTGLDCFLLEHKVLLTKIEVLLNTVGGITVGMEAFKMIVLPVSSNTLAGLFCVMEGLAMISVIHYIACDHDVTVIKTYILLVAVTSFALLLLISFLGHMTRSRDVGKLCLLFVLSSSISIARVVVGYQTLNDPHIIDQWHCSGALFILTIGLLTALNGFTLIVEITVSLITDDSPFKSFMVTIITKKGILRRKIESFTGIWGHKWSAEDIRSYPFFRPNYQPSIEAFKLRKTQLHTSNFQQQHFDEKLLDVFSSFDKEDYPFLNDILTATSIAFSKAAARYEDVPLYEYLRSCSDSKKISRPSIIFSMIGGGIDGSRNLPFKTLSIELYSFKTYQQSIDYANDTFRRLNTISRTAMNLPNNLSTTTLPDGSLLVHLNHADHFWLTLVPKDSRVPPIPKIPSRRRLFSFTPCKQLTSPAICVYLKANAHTFWNGATYEYNNNTFGTEELAQYYFELAQFCYISCIEKPFATENECQEIPFGTFSTVLGNRDLSQIPKSINGISYSLYESITISNFIQTSQILKNDCRKIIITGPVFSSTETILADLACAVNANKIDLGGVQRAEYNRLLQIEAEMSHVEPLVELFCLH